jgi:hypothetical protein
LYPLQMKIDAVRGPEANTPESYFEFVPQAFRLRV